MAQKHGNKYGTHRVIEPVGVLPQPANKVDNNTDEIYDNEILIDVQTLNIDSASFTDISNRANHDPEKIKEIMFDIVAKQGKHRNPWTGSGGMLLGKVEKIGDALKDNIDLKVGDRIATLVSLSLTPLRIDEILEIRPEIDQVDIKGKAILFESGIYAKIPSDLPEKLSLSALDVAGAPAQTAKLCQYGQNVVILGAGGKSGMLCCYEAKKRVGVTGKVIGLANSPKSTNRIKELGFCDVVESVKGLTPVQVGELVSKLTNGKMADVTINCVNVPDQEMTAILCTKDNGTVYFFSMATSFTKASLGAEGIGADVNMIMGNGYTKGHAEFTLQELRESEKLRKIFEELYA
ncbi:MAG: L-erythro-3,5-diaminohexanoate dehydrogenase [Bacteroidales bacterium]|nr:L-erythro-3,5-diaminohexanoate dehydrogenase [Candidatus Cacconaster equi]